MAKKLQSFWNVLSWTA